MRAKFLDKDPSNKDEISRCSIKWLRNSCVDTGCSPRNLSFSLTYTTSMVYEGLNFWLRNCSKALLHTLALLIHNLLVFFLIWKPNSSNIVEMSLLNLLPCLENTNLNKEHYFKAVSVKQQIDNIPAAALLFVYSVFKFKEIVFWWYWNQIQKR